MPVLGIDVGAATTKAVVMADGEILSWYIMQTGHDINEASETVISQTLAKTTFSKDELDYIVSTGYGRNGVRFANKAITEILCHAKGAYWMMPETRTIIDIGGQDSKAIGIDGRGNVENFVMNDKCAAGTGRFLEVMAKVLNLELDELGPVSLTSKAPCQISNTCTVFAESEVVSLRAEGKSREDLIAGIHRAAARRIRIMASAVGFTKEVVLTGGVAQNIGLKQYLEKEIGLTIVVPPNPQIIGALGAALFAGAKAN